MSARDDAHGDATRDALGLIQACHNGDLEGGRCLLDNGNLRLTAAALARIAADLLETMCEDPAEALLLLRQYHAGGG